MLWNDITIQTAVHILFFEPVTSGQNKKHEAQNPTHPPKYYYVDCSLRSIVRLGYTSL